MIEHFDLLNCAIVYDRHQLFIFKPILNETCSNCTYILHRKKPDTLYIYDFDLGKVIAKTPLPKDIRQLDDYLVENDTFYGISNSRFVLTYDLNNRMNDLATKYILRDYGLLIALYLNKEADGLHFNIMKSDLINTAEKLSSFYEGFVDAKVQLESDSIRIIEKSVNYPKHYAKEYNLNFTHVSSAVSPQTTVFSFINEPHVLIKKKGKQFQNSTMTSNFYIKSPSINKSDALNQNHLETLKYTHFAKISYNPYREEFYRVAIHPATSIDKRPYSRSWSLIVADSLLNTKYEVYFEKGQSYIYNKIIPTQKGFGVPVFSGDFDTKEELKLHEFELD